MKARIFLIPAGLMLLLAACLPDLPEPRMRINVDLLPAETSFTPFDWTIEGNNHRGEPDDYEGECAGGCDDFSEIISKGDWTLRVTPPDLSTAQPAHQWVGIGRVPAPAEGAEQEVSADYIEVFAATVSEGEMDLTATFRRPNDMSFTFVTSAVGELASITLNDVITKGADFELAGVTAICQEGTSLVELEFGGDFSESPITISAAAQSIPLQFSGEPIPLTRTTSISCTFSLFDSDFRPLVSQRMPAS